jgi:hypothetical protein
LDEHIEELGAIISNERGSGTAARQFRYEADAGIIGINIGVAAPMPTSL